MKTIFTFEPEPFEGYSEFDEQANRSGEEGFGTGLTDLEWEQEARRISRLPIRRPVISAKPLPKRPSRPPIRPPRPPRTIYPVWPVSVTAGRERSQPGTEYIRWVQHSLNLILGLQLPVDGVMNPQTREAIRDFQRRMGLRADGIVGPEMQQALVDERRKLAAGGAPSELETEFFEFTELPLSEETELGFGEAGEEEFSFGSLSSYVPSGMESVLVRSAMRSGTTNENSLTDLIFFRRHPERNGRAISRSDSDFQRLIQESLSIRDTLVRPILRGTAPARRRPSPAPGTGGGTGVPDIVTVRSVFKVARQIAPKLEALLAAAEGDGIRLGHNSSFRTREEQIALRRKYCGPTDFDIFEKPSSQCTPQVARPGTSNHEKGLAIDFSYNGTKMGPDNPGFRWLAANAGCFDFYNLPGEPWHWSVDGK